LAHVLRDIVESDLDAFYEHQREPEATEMALLPARKGERRLRMRLCSTMRFVAVAKAAKSRPGVVPVWSSEILALALPRFPARGSG
jgi:hypothetical protein